MDIKEIKFILANTPTFNKLKDEELDELLTAAEIKEYKNGEIIYRLGDPPGYFYFILKGRVVALASHADREVEIDLLKRGTSFGIISLFTDEPHSVTTKSIEQSSILKVEKNNFKQFLNSHPTISLDFSRMLSQRVRAQLMPKRIFQFKRIAVLGFPSSGKTTYLWELGRALGEVTKRKIICLEVSSTDNFILPLLAKGGFKVFSLSESSDEDVSQCIVHSEVDYLLVKTKQAGQFCSLLNVLSESYHFILYEIPFYLWDEYLDEFIAPSDHIHFIIYSQLEELKKASILIEELKNKSPINREKIKIVVNEFGSRDNLSCADERSILNCPVYATLPPREEASYSKALLRIGRQVSDSVVGIALGSGSAYGFSHIGVLRMLEEHHISIDMICGSSMGAVIATLWALGLSSEEITALAKEFTKRISRFSFPRFSFPFQGVVKAKRLERICKKIFGNKTFYDIKHVLKIVAFDFSKKEITVLEEGPLYKAVAASCAMPGIFEPVKVKEEFLLDGGVLNPLPTKILLNYGANKIIAVNITPSQEEIYKEYKKRNKLHVFDFIFGSIETMQREFIQHALGIADVVIHPNFEGLGWMEFEKTEEFIARGEQAVREKLGELESLI